MKITKEMKKWFNKRTLNHINLVDKWYNIITNELPFIYKQKNLKKKHDSSKFKRPEYLPYVVITWNYHMKKLKKSFDIPEGIKVKMNKATIHHITHNKHHPEYWDDDFDPKENFNSNDRDSTPDKIVDATSMPDKYLVEMVADWLAVSEERKTNPYDWFKSNVNIRWKFSKSQVGLIKKCLSVWDSKE